MSEVTPKRGLASPCVHSAFATTRRRRLQLLRVVHLKVFAMARPKVLVPKQDAAE